MNRKLIRFICLPLAIATTACMCSCKDTKTNSSSSASSGAQKIPYEYELEQYTEKFWEGDTVYWESITFIQNKDGVVEPCPLMYTPKEVLSVRSGDMMLEYRNGIDYKVENGKIVWLESGMIPFCSYDKYSPKYPEGKSDWLVSALDSSRYIAIDGSVRAAQVMVTYTHEDTWKAAKPQSEADKLPKTMAKLQNKQQLKVVFYGDSITTGGDASGNKETYIDPTTLEEVQANGNSSPYTPSFAEMLISKMKKTYGYDDIVKINRAAGTTSSVWGADHVAELVNPHNPDLVVIGFGMNEPGRSAEDFKQSMTMIMDSIRSANPNAEFLLVSCMMPNPDAAAFANDKLGEQEAALYELQAQYGSVAVAPVNKMNKALIEQGKRFIDFTGNALNHPNDFSVRIYAQTLMATLGL